MAALGIEYVEICVRDAASAADYFMSSLGFSRVAKCSDYNRDSLLLRQGSMQLIVTAGAGISEFLELHGDGISDIALTCDDVDRTTRTVAAAGVPVSDSEWGNPAAAGFGGVRHTLRPVSAAPGTGLPAGRDWIQTPSGREPSVERIRLLDHVAVCLEAGTLEEYARVYEDGFGLSRYSSEYTELGDQAMDSIVVRSASGGVTFTLLAQDSTRQAGQIEAFLDRNGGPGVQHLAFEVDDIIPAVHQFRSQGVEFLSTPDTYYEMLAERFPEMLSSIADLRATRVLADRDEWGYLLQLFTRSPYEQNTLFYELIQRRGARGFGSANIRALYEAVERDRLAAQ